MISRLEVDSLGSFSRTACVPGRSGSSRSAGRLRCPKRTISSDHMDGANYQGLKSKRQGRTTANGAVVPDVAPGGAASCAHWYLSVHDAGAVGIFLPKPIALVAALDDLLGYRKLDREYDLSSPVH